MLDRTSNVREPARRETPPQPRTYVNHVALRFTLSEVCIDFGQEFAGNQETVTYCRLVTSPTHLVRVRTAIDTAITRYQDQFGAIPGSGAEAGHG